MSLPSYNMEQRVMALNWFSNMASNKTGSAADLQARLQQDILNLFTDDTIRGMIGDWTLEWGPVVMELGIDARRSHVATNAMYVARQKKYNGENDHYVVAIAGTNAVSLYGWFVEDFKTEEMVLWKNAGTNTDAAKPYKDRCAPAGAEDPAAPRVSQGTCIGLTVLLDMKGRPNVGEKKSLLGKPEIAWGEPITLLKFLTDRFGKGTPADLLTITGHSLGGALCSALALRLAELQWNPQNPGSGTGWNPSHSVNLTAMPTAGPSAGNKAFSEYYNNTMGMKTIRVWNGIDPVPYGHHPSMLQYVPHLYYPYIVPDAGLYLAAGLLLSNSYRGTASTYKEGGYYTQIMPQVAPLRGQFNNVFVPLPPGTVFQFVVDFVYSKILEYLDFSPEKIKSILLVVNTILKVEKWLGIEGFWVEQLVKELTKLFGDKDAGKLTDVFKWLVNNVSAVGAFLQQLGYQHVWAYADLLNMTGFKKAVEAITKDPHPTDLFEWLLKYESEALAKWWHNIWNKDELKKLGVI